MRSSGALTAAVALTTAWVIERYHPTLPDSARLRMHLRPVAEPSPPATPQRKLAPHSFRGIVRAMSAKLARLKNGYTTGGRGLGMRLMGRFHSVPVTPNQLTVAGLSLNGVAAILIYKEHFVWAFVAFIARLGLRHPRRRAGPLARQAHTVRRIPRLHHRPHQRGPDPRLDRAGARRRGQDLGARERVRGARRLVPRQLHPRQGRGHRPAAVRWV